MDKPPFEPTKNPKKMAVAGKKGYGPSAAAHLAKQGMSSMMKKAKDMKEEVHPDALHVSMVKKDNKPMYKVHKVGLNFSDKIKKGEHLSDTELDDFSDMGGKVKHIKENKTLRELLAIFEGRGRPRKNPDDPKWKKAPPTEKRDDEEDDEDEKKGPERPESPHLEKEPDQHITVQLKRAVDAKDEKGGSDVKFANGKTHFVKHDVAHKILSATEKLKPADRGPVHDHIAQSHDNLMAVHKMVS